MQEQNCEKIVARPEPRTPIRKVKIKIGSNTILITAPIKTALIAINEYPCVSINGIQPLCQHDKKRTTGINFQIGSSKSDSTGWTSKEQHDLFRKQKSNHANQDSKHQQHEKCRIKNAIGFPTIIFTQFDTGSRRTAKSNEICKCLNNQCNR